ncbi:MAG TPA: outer membrane beta-barrel protein [Dinghuibacter sp.]|uniref:outer membrane beta-barrel protein n=1 Tax=Dinghuibacter sp. TaxID=2024697 RepID=UPI002C19F1EF|nr:outer membrane beta-barrel protein [Dinghuibacter sp.]HTJ11024.1 outer membrane beta-barrel protein [Dinghuibacter sp.]
MKHFLLPVALLTALPISAQTLNVEAGVSISKLQDSFTREFYSQHITTPTFGLGLQYFERKYFDLSTNVAYLRKGGHEPYAYNDASGQPRGADFTLDYVSVNTLAEPKIPLDKHLGLFISVGPRLDFLAGHQDSNVVFHAQPLQKTAFGLTLGGGFHYTISRLRFTGQADYLSNSTHIYTNGTTTVYDRTITITFSAGYRL